MRDVKNDLCKFQISMKFENTAIRSSRSSSGEGVSRLSINGVRKCYNRNVKCHDITRKPDYQSHRVNQFQAF